MGIRPTLATLWCLIAVALAVTGCSDGGTDSASSTTVPEPTEAEAACVREQSSGTQELSIVVDGVTRQYLLAMPSGLDPADTAPLVVDLHGFSSNAQQQSMLSALGDAAGEGGYVVATPQALEVDVPLTTGSLRTTFWNIDPAAVRPGFDPADDLGFIDALLDQVIEEQCIDPDRLFVTGMSNGAGMTMALVCGSNTRFAAAAPVAGANLVGTCEPERSIPLHAFHGDADPLIPAAGGQVVGQDYEVVAVQDRMQDLADLANCTDPALETPFADIEVRTWSDCDDGTELVLTTVLGGGHTWPGSDLLEGLGDLDGGPPPQPEGQAEFLDGFDFSAVAGEPTESISATNLILDFFDRHDSGGS